MLPKRNFLYSGSLGSFNSKSTLDSEATVTVYTGEGTNSATELYWGSGNLIWNNDGDTAYLYDISGKVVSTLEG